MTNWSAQKHKYSARQITQRTRRHVQPRLPLTSSMFAQHYSKESMEHECQGLFSDAIEKHLFFQLTFSLNVGSAQFDTELDLVNSHFA